MALWTWISSQLVALFFRSVEGMMCAPYFLLSKMKERETFMFSATWSSSRTFQPIDKKNKGNAAWSFPFCWNKYTWHETSNNLPTPFICTPCEGAYSFSLNDILKTGCQAHLSLHLQLICVCMRFPHAVQFSGREQFVSFLHEFPFWEHAALPPLEELQPSHKIMGNQYFLKIPKWILNTTQKVISSIIQLGIL